MWHSNAMAAVAIAVLSWCAVSKVSLLCAVSVFQELGVSLIKGPPQNGVSF